MYEQIYRKFAVKLKKFSFLWELLRLLNYFNEMLHLSEVHEKKTYEIKSITK